MKFEKDLNPPLWLGPLRIAVCSLAVRMSWDSAPPRSIARTAPSAGWTSGAKDWVQQPQRSGQWVCHL